MSAFANLATKCAIPFAHGAPSTVVGTAQPLLPTMQPSITGNGAVLPAM